MAQVTLRKVVKKYDEVLAVRGIDLDITDKEFIVLVGPSGCGKSTTLRMIAGHESTTSGDILLENRNITSLPAAARGTANVTTGFASRVMPSLVSVAVKVTSCGVRFVTVKSTAPSPSVTPLGGTMTALLPAFAGWRSGTRAGGQRDAGRHGRFRESAVGQAHHEGGAVGDVARHRDRGGLRQTFGHQVAAQRDGEGGTVVIGDGQRALFGRGHVDGGGAGFGKGLQHGLACAVHHRVVHGRDGEADLRLAGGDHHTLGDCHRVRVGIGQHD